ncbi:cytochrome P450 CYP82D47-like [Andrographis paniculata]|uniref:cytochrome P450 CYP82D47-like n=1 Tax=Andrographis paniculata TaxID=175694 RepID=UPI0021E9238D|nr:cytochrome P450 CYP82D47-like [Andrographis paniculata]
MDMAMPMEIGLLSSYGFTAIFCIAIVLLYTTLTKHREKNLPPEAAGGRPLIGHLSLLSGPELPHAVLSDMADKYGAVFTIRLGAKRGLIISSWEAAKECLTTNDVVFGNRPKTSAIQHMSYNFAMFGFSGYGAYWRELRKISVLNLLSNHKVAQLGNDLLEHELKSMMRSLNSEGKAEMKKYFGDLTLNLMARIVAGDVGSDKEVVEGDKWRKAIKEFFRMMDVLTMADVLPFLKWFENTKEFERTGGELDGVLQAWLDEHKKRNRLEESGSFMGEMIGSAEKVARAFEGYDADTINKATCQVLMLGGTYTISATLTWTLCLLLNNRDVLTKALEELDTHVGRARRVQSSDLSNLVYIRAIIKETLRLYPPAPILPPRESVANCTVAGYHIPAGTRLMINAWKLHRDPRIWSDPLKFEPERFLTDHKEIDFKGGVNFELVPFGGGRRVCPGISFSLQVVELTIASLLQGFDIETLSDECVDMRGSFGSTNMKATPLEVVLKPRLPTTLYG